jgi:hypothetical protein
MNNLMSTNIKTPEIALVNFALKQATYSEIKLIGDAVAVIKSPSVWQDLLWCVTSLQQNHTGLISCH